MIAQIILTTRYENPLILTQSALCSRGYRIYAITMKNTIIAGLFVCITIPQCALGIYMIVLAARAPGMASISVGICPCLLVLIRWKSSPNTPSYPPHGIPVMRLHQTPEGRTCLYCHLALLRFAFFFRQKIPVSTHSHNRLFGVSGDHCPRGKVRDQRLQDARYPSDDCSRRNDILLGYLHISLCARDDINSGKGKHLHCRRRSDSEVSPAKPSALAGCVSARFYVY